MLKSWFISLIVLILLGFAFYADLFVWLSSGNAVLIGAGLLAAVLIAAFVILGNPFKK